MGSETSRDRQEAGIPPGWDDNPSTWKQRLPIVAIALVAFVAAMHLALVQVEIVSKPWEPFFGRGSAIILDSWVSRLLPARCRGWWCSSVSWSGRSA
jgi:hypothetical protein